MSKKHNIIRIISALIILGALVLRYMLAAKHNIPVGWDGGVYRHYLLSYASQFPDIRISQMSEHIVQGFPPFLGILVATLGLIGISVDHVITVGPFVLIMLMGLATYWLLRTWSDRRAMIGALLVTFSSIIFFMGWSGFLKQMLAMVLLLVLIKSVVSQHYLFGCLVHIALMFTHRPTALFSVVILVIFLIALRDTKVQWKTSMMLIWAGTITTLLYLPILDTLIFGLLDTGNVTAIFQESSGTFFSRSKFLAIQLPVLALVGIAIIGFVQKAGPGNILKVTQTRDTNETKEQTHLRKMIWIAWIVSVLWFIFGALFHNRMQPFLDLTSILLVSITLIPILMTKTWGKKLVVVTIALQIGLSTYLAAANNEQKISPSEQKIIQNLANYIPKDAFILTNNFMSATWLMGYSDLFDRIIAPGISDYQDDWDATFWQIWQGGDGYKKCEFIFDNYADGYSPLYLYVGQMSQTHNSDLDGGYCLYEMLSEGPVSIYEIRYP